MNLSIDLAVPADVHIGIFRYQPGRKNLCFSDADRLFVGSWDEFRAWHGADVLQPLEKGATPVCIRIRHKWLRELEGFGVAYRGGIVLTHANWVDPVCAPPNFKRRS